MDNTTKKFNKLIEDYCNTDNGLLLIYGNEARVMLQRDIECEPDYLMTILGEVVRRDLEEYIPETKEVYINLIMAALDQVDFDLVAKPFITNAIEDKRNDADIEETNESLRREFKCAS